MLDINDSSTDAARGCNYYIRLIETAANYWMLAGIRTAQASIFQWHATCGKNQEWLLLRCNNKRGAWKSRMYSDSFMPRASFPCLSASQQLFISSVGSHSMTVCSTGRLPLRPAPVHCPCCAELRYSGEPPCLQL